MNMKNYFYFFAIVVSLILAACGGEDEPNVKFENATISYGQTYSIPNGKNIVWTSSNELIATVDGNIVTAKRVGEAVISSEKGSFKVSVTPTSYVFTEPCIQWGADKKSVKSYMNNVSGVTINEDTNTTLNYKGTGKALLYSYSFENSALKGSGIGLDGDYIDAEAMADFMIERYVPIEVDEDNYSFYFVSPDKKTGVLMQLKVSGRTIIYLVVYVPVGDSRSDYDIAEQFNEYDNAPSDVAKNVFMQLKARF